MVFFDQFERRVGSQFSLNLLLQFSAGQTEQRHGLRKMSRGRGSRCVKLNLEHAPPLVK
jgi:hypothetical protein